MKSNDSCMDTLKFLNRNIRKSPVYKGKSVFREGSSCGELSSMSSLELPLVVDKPVVEARVVPFKYLLLEKGGLILPEVDFEVANIVHEGRIFTNDLHWFSFYLNTSGLTVHKVLKGQLHLVRFKGEAGYHIQAVVLC